MLSCSAPAWRKRENKDKRWRENALAAAKKGIYKQSRGGGQCYGVADWDRQQPRCGEGMDAVAPEQSVVWVDLFSSPFGCQGRR